jgi:hypothetical protein
MKVDTTELELQLLEAQDKIKNTKNIVDLAVLEDTVRSIKNQIEEIRNQNGIKEEPKQTKLEKLEVTSTHDTTRDEKKKSEKFGDRDFVKNESRKDKELYSTTI